MRVIRLGLKVLILGLLAAAILNPSIPVGTAPRCRVYLIDRSQSVLAQQAVPGALRTAEVIQTINFDMSRLNPGDWVGLALFGRTFAYQMPPRRRGEEMPVISDLSAEVEAGGSDILEALRAVRFQMPEESVREVVLFSDGNFEDPAPSVAATARALGLSLFCIGVGDPQAKDVRIVRVDPPRVLREGDTYAIDVEVESTQSGPVTVSCDETKKQIQLVAGRRAVVRLDGFVARDTRRSISVKAVSDGFEDICPENNQVRLDLLFEQRKPKMLVLAGAEPSAIARAMSASYDVRVSKSFEPPADYHVLVLENFPAPVQSSMEDIQAYVTALGGGLVVIGGEKAFGKTYQGTPLEKVMPLWAMPDERSAIVFVLDSSGSMDTDLAGKKKIRWLTEAVLAASAKLGDKDEVAVVTFSDHATLLHPLASLEDRAALSKKLQDIHPNGPTHVVNGLVEAIRVLKDQPRGVQHLVLITDGEIPKDDKGEQSLERFQELGKELEQLHIGITMYVTGAPGDLQRLTALKGPIYQIAYADLGPKVAEKTVADRRLFAERASIKLMPHELTEGLADFTAPWMNRTSRKADATLLAENSAGDPAAAVWRAGTGSCAAFAYAAEDGGVIARAVRWATSKRQPGRFSATFDHNRLRVRVDVTGPVPGREIGETDGTFQHPRTGVSGKIHFVRTGEKQFEGILERPLSGSYHIDLPVLQARGAVDVMCEPELMRLGIDSKALGEMGTLIGSINQIHGAHPASQGIVEEDLRPWLAALAMAILLLELVLGAFWKG